MTCCSGCGASGRLWKWETRVCADGRRKRVFWLCDSCDISRNRETLLLVGDRNIAAKMSKYAAKVRAKH